MPGREAGDDPPRVSERAQIPRATYRLQLNRDFTLRDATALVPYFAELGVSHLYCSPYMRARPGSMHGYDVVDHNSLNPEIGTPDDLDRFVAALRAHDMGHILDWVPNHVGIMGADNAWWMDVLENGEASAYAGFFDIDWENVDPALAGRVLVPVLGDYYGSVLERGELVLKFEDAAGSFAVFYHEHRFPADPRCYPRILERALALSDSAALGEEDRADFSSLIAAFGHLPDRRDLAPAALEERQRDKEANKRRLMRLCARAPRLPSIIESAVRELNGAAGDPGSFDALHQLLESQAYRLAYWRVAADEINYRRFFDVNDLAALRMENEAVFDATHQLVLRLIGEGKVDGLRIDHPDGLYDPAQYFRRLQERVASVRGGGVAVDARDLPLYLIVEKITADFEPLRADWAVHGATGYRFVNVVGGLFVDGGARSRLDRIYRTFTGEHAAWSAIAHDAKRRIVDTSLAAELNVLAGELERIARTLRRTRDFTERSLGQALAEVIACFPVYRTYIAAAVAPEDRRYIDWAIALARRRDTSTDAAVYDFVRSVLLAENPAVSADGGGEARPDGASVRSLAAASRRFAMRFQQVTAPVTAKGVEDTALYRFDRLVSLNEVGGDPDRFGTSVRAFHADARYRARHWPHELLATSTHDTKRSEDVRVRIDVLSEMPREWRGMLTRWKQMNRSRRRTLDDLPAPSPNDEYLLYQTLIGTLPLDAGEAPLDPARAPQAIPTNGTPPQPAREPHSEAAPALPADYTPRIEAYMVKAMREAKVRTSWANIDSAYEDAVQQFIREILDFRPGNLFLADIAGVVRRIARFGLYNSLSQTLCKLAAPGVPDIYQGTELWDFSLVDPDNRRPVDYERRRRMIGEITSRLRKSGSRGADPAGPQTAFVRELLDTLPDGRAKLYLIARGLEVRREHPELFALGSYVALRVVGPRSSHLLAFMRRWRDGVAIAAAPRLCARLLGGNAGSPIGHAAPLGEAVWGDTRIELPRGIRLGVLENALDGARVAVRELDGRRSLAAAGVFASFPVALLTGAAVRS